MNAAASSSYRSAAELPDDDADRDQCRFCGEGHAETACPFKESGVRAWMFEWRATDLRPEAWR